MFGFCALLLILCSICLPGSRSGTALAAVLLVAVGVAAGWRLLGRGNPFRKHRILSSVVCLSIVLALGATLGLTWPSLTGEWQRAKQEWEEARELGRLNPRFYVARDTLDLVLDRPWFGWGAGSYVAVFPVYQGDYDRDAQGRPTALWDEAHCDWLQFPAEYGLVGLALLVATAALTAARVLPATKNHLTRSQESGVRSQELDQRSSTKHQASRSKNSAARSFWALTGCALLAIYALGDFPFQNPAVLLLWTVMLVTAGCSATSQTAEGSRQTTEAHGRRMTDGRRPTNPRRAERVSTNFSDSCVSDV
jgi:O-antigen ligase